MSYASTAASVATKKRTHPELYCPAKNCLWNTGDGSYCPRHGGAKTERVRKVLCAACGHAGYQPDGHCDSCGGSNAAVQGPNERLARVEKAHKLTTVFRTAHATSDQVVRLDDAAWSIAAQIAEVNPPSSETKLLVIRQLVAEEFLAAACAISGFAL